VDSNTKDFLKQVNEIKSFRKKIDLCNNRLQKLGVGSSRIVYDLGDNKVLKLAKNAKGIAQNNAECDIYFSSKNELLNIIYECADDDSYVIAQKANKINERKFIQLLNVPSITNMRELIAIVGKWYYDVFRKTLFYGKPTLTDEDHELIDELSDEGGFLDNLHDLVANYNFNPSDMFRIANIGSIIHDGQEQLVLIDYGFTDKTSQLYRKKINEANTVSEVSLSLINEIPKGNTFHDKYTPSYYNELKKDIQANGIKEPITLKYYYETNTLELGEGHHRLQIANELNLKTIPVQIKVIYEGKINKASLKSSDKNKTFQAPIKLDIEKYEKRNYFPTYINPSEIGLIQNLNENKKLKLVIESLVKKELRKVLNEGASDILYHFTNDSALYNIAKTNNFNLSAAIKGDFDFTKNKNRFFYMSTTRSKSSGYKRGNVKIVLDGRKLKHNNKIVPVDYWGWGPERFEQEDRIISNKNTIENASKYILEIHILLNDSKDEEDMNLYLNKMKFIKNYSDKSSLPIFFYNNEKNFFKQTNSIDFNKIKMIDINQEPSSRRFWDYDFASFISYKNEEIFNKIKNFILNNEGYDLESFIESCNKFKNNTYKLNYDVYKADKIATYKNDFHTIRSSPNELNRFIVKLFILDLKKNNIQSMSEYMNFKIFFGLKTINMLKKELIDFIIDKLKITLNESIKSNFNSSIEINGIYYNKAYESKELINVINKYFNIIKNFIIKTINNPNINDLKQIYIDRNDIKEELNINNIKLSNEINITDSYYYNIDDYNYDFIFFIENLTHYIDYYDKSRELQDEYNKQFYNN
jgi:hypothetical protein